MPGKHSRKGGRKHTTITSEKQRGLFGAEYARRKRGEKGRMPGITKEELRSHLKEAGGKSLPDDAKQRKARSLLRGWRKGKRRK